MFNINHHSSFSKASFFMGAAVFAAGFINITTTEAGISMGRQPRILTIQHCRDNPLEKACTKLNKTMEVQFSGMYGSHFQADQDLGSFLNPVTNELKCPNVSDGYTGVVQSDKLGTYSAKERIRRKGQKEFGTLNVDWTLWLCRGAFGYQMTGRRLDFGGMFSKSLSGQVLQPNPLANNTASCPAGYLTAQVKGSLPNSSSPFADANIYYCYQFANGDDDYRSEIHFGGMFSYSANGGVCKDGVPPAGAAFCNYGNNALPNHPMSCPAGFSLGKAAGDGVRDADLYYCYLDRRNAKHHRHHKN